MLLVAGAEHRLQRCGRLQMAGGHQVPGDGEAEGGSGRTSVAHTASWPGSSLRSGGSTILSPCQGGCPCTIQRGHTGASCLVHASTAVVARSPPHASCPHQPLGTMAPHCHQRHPVGTHPCSPHPGGLIPAACGEWERLVTDGKCKKENESSGGRSRAHLQGSTATAVHQGAVHWGVRQWGAAQWGPVQQGVVQWGGCRTTGDQLCNREPCNSCALGSCTTGRCATGRVLHRERAMQ